MTESTKTVPAWWRQVAIVAGLLALLFLVLWLVAGLPGELSESDKREQRICVMSKVMEDSTLDYETAKLLCRQP